MEHPEVERMEPEDMMLSFDKVGPGKAVMSGFVTPLIPGWNMILINPSYLFM